MVTHQDLLSQYKSETGKYPTKGKFIKWLEEKYLNIVNSEQMHTFENDILLTPDTVDRFWGLEFIEDGKKG